MKTIDIKSLIIGALLATTVILGIAAQHSIDTGAGTLKVEVTLKNGTQTSTFQKFEFGK